MVKIGCRLYGSEVVEPSDIVGLALVTFSYLNSFATSLFLAHLFKKNDALGFSFQHRGPAINCSRHEIFAHFPLKQ